MPISKIEIDEYECAWCRYKWVNRVNGKDGPIPKRCAKCKRWNWQKGRRKGVGSSFTLSDIGKIFGLNPVEAARLQRSQEEEYNLIAKVVDDQYQELKRLGLV